MAVCRITPGLRVRAYDTDFCRKAPNDLKPSYYNEGVITKIEPFVGAVFKVYYRIDKLILNGAATPQSWLMGTEASFNSNQHYFRILSDQLNLTL